MRRFNNYFYYLGFICEILLFYHYINISSNTDNENINANDRIDISGGLLSSVNRITLFNKIMLAAMKKPGTKQRIAQVLPIIRSMSPTQRLTLATLVLNQLMTKSIKPNLESTYSLSDNTTSELMVPISADIASIFYGLGKDTESGRSTNFGVILIFNKFIAAYLSYNRKF